MLPLGSRGDYGNILTLSGSGISNDSGRDQQFVINGDVLSGFPAIGFTGQATAGNQTIFTFNRTVDFRNSANAGSATFRCNNGFMQFAESSSASNANITFNVLGDHLSQVGFYQNATAGNSTITLNPSSPTGTYTRGAGVGFDVGATAGGATIVAHGADAAFGGEAYMTFSRGSTAGHAFLTATGGTNGGNGGSIFFVRGSDGGAARVAVFGNASLNAGDFILRTARGFLTIGSIEGDGFIYLGTATTLITGSNDLNTTFAGVIQDEPSNFTGKTGGSLQKSGKASSSCNIEIPTPAAPRL